MTSIYVFFDDFSAGVGRTGVFITLSIVLERMQYEGVVDVFQSVRALRTQRPAMVQVTVSAGKTFDFRKSVEILRNPYLSGLNLPNLTVYYCRVIVKKCLIVFWFKTT